MEAENGQSMSIKKLHDCASNYRKTGVSAALEHITSTPIVKSWKYAHQKLRFGSWPTYQEDITQVAATQFNNVRTIAVCKDILHEHYHTTVSSWPGTLHDHGNKYTMHASVSMRRTGASRAHQMGCKLSHTIQHVELRPYNGKIACTKP
eukprot:1158557-Pelagomonas_calceolata.AAC.2